MIPPISITIMHIPVIIGAVTMGPLFGGILGASFGVMSMLKATFAAASPADIIFSPFISGTPVQSLILCVVPRILLGVIAAWLFIGLKKLIKNETASIGLSAGIATLCHSAMVLGLMWFLFDSLPLKEVFATMMSLNCLLEIAMLSSSAWRYASRCWSISVAKADPKIGLNRPRTRLDIRDIAF